MLMNAGRELAGSLLVSAVESAESFEQMNNQIFLLRRAAISILAHEAYNQHRQLELDVDEYNTDLLVDIEKEFAMVEAGKFELVTTKERPN